MKPTIIRRQKDTPVEEPQTKVVAEIKTEKTQEHKPQNEEVKSKPQPTREPRAKLDPTMLLSELAQLDRSAFDKLLQTPQNISVGQQIEGTIIRIEKELYILDINAKSEAFLWKENAESQDLSVNTTITAIVTSISSNGIHLAQNTKEQVSQKLVNAKTEQTPIEATVVQTNHGGFILSAHDMRGFCPKSQIDIHPLAPETYLNQTLSFLVTDVNAKEFVASRKKLQEQEQKEEASTILSSLSQGQTGEGIVRTITDFGAFLSAFGMDGLLPKRKIPIDKELSVGDKVSIKIDSINLEKQTLSLSLDHKDPWLELGHKYRINEAYEGKVMQEIEHGVLVSLQFELVGLIHSSKIPSGRTFTIGESLQVYISSFDLSQKKLRFQLEPPVVISAEHRPTGHSLSDMVRDLFTSGEIHSNKKKASAKQKKKS